MWKEGIIGIPTKNGEYKKVKYWVKHFDEPSEDYGINGGKISKLSLKMDASGLPTTTEAGTSNQPAKKQKWRFAFF